MKVSELLLEMQLKSFIKSLSYMDRSILFEVAADSRVDGCGSLVTKETNLELLKKIAFTDDGKEKIENFITAVWASKKNKTGKRTEITKINNEYTLCLNSIINLINQKEQALKQQVNG